MQQLTFKLVLSLWRALKAVRVNAYLTTFFTSQLCFHLKMRESLLKTLKITLKRL